MLRRTLVAYPTFIFFGLLSSVTGDEGFPANNLPNDGLPFVISTIREKCPEHPELPPCRRWDFIQNAIINSESPYKPKQTVEVNPENKTSWNEISDENFQEENPDAENHLQKRFTVFRRKNPVARGYKRGPGFRSWGGKRDSTTPDTPEKRSKFASWGGKRDGELFTEDGPSGEIIEKRPKFQNWGGKKSTDDFLEEFGKFDKRGPIWKDRVYYLSEPFKKHVPKRPQFQSWGGKRASYPWHDFYDYFQPKYMLNAGEKRKFSSWGGKRYDENQRGADYWGESGEDMFKRHVFQNWGGKRADEFEGKDSESKEKTKDSAGGRLQISNLKVEEGGSRR